MTLKPDNQGEKTKSPVIRLSRTHLRNLDTDACCLCTQLLFLLLHLWVGLGPQVVRDNLMAEHWEALLCEFLWNSKEDNKHLYTQTSILLGQQDVIKNSGTFKKQTGSYLPMRMIQNWSVANMTPRPESWWTWAGVESLI